MGLSSPFIARSSAVPPTVAHVCRTYFNVSENWIDSLVRHTSGYRPLVLAMRTANIDSAADVMGYGVMERPRIESLLNRAVERITGYFPSSYAAIVWQRAKIIHAHFGPVGYKSLPLAASTGRPLITSFYGQDASRLPRQVPEWRDRYRRLFDQGALFLAEGPVLAERLRLLGCPPDKVRLHRLGIESDMFPFRVRNAEPGRPLAVLIVGRFTAKKGIPVALRAVAAAIRRGSDIVATVIGDADPRDHRQSEEKRRILDILDEEDLRNRVTLLGMVPPAELRRMYYLHDVLLSPSETAPDGDTEGGAPVTIIEAAATGMAVVSTFHADIPYVIEDRRTGLLSPEGDVGGVASHLVSLAADPDRLRELGEAAATRMRIHYDAAQQGRELASHYDRIA